jgi:hypothetical protein
MTKFSIGEAARLAGMSSSALYKVYMLARRKWVAVRYAANWVGCRHIVCSRVWNKRWVWWEMLNRVYDDRGFSLGIVTMGVIKV